MAKQIKPVTVDKLMELVQDEGDQYPKAVIGRVKYADDFVQKDGNYGKYQDQSVALESANGVLIRGWNKNDAVDFTDIRGQIVVIAVPEEKMKSPALKAVESGKYINLHIGKMAEVYLVSDESNLDDNSDGEWRFDLSGVKLPKGNGNSQPSKNGGGSSGKSDGRNTGGNTTVPNSTRKVYKLSEIVTKYAEALAMAKDVFLQLGLQPDAQAVQSSAATCFIAYNNQSGSTFELEEEEVEEEVEEEETEEVEEDEEVDEEDTDDAEEEEDEEEESPKPRSRQKASSTSSKASTGAKGKNSKESAKPAATNGKKSSGTSRKK